MVIDISEGKWFNNFFSLIFLLTEAYSLFLLPKSQDRLKNYFRNPLYYMGKTPNFVSYFNVCSKKF